MQLLLEPTKYYTQDLREANVVYWSSSINSYITLESESKTWLKLWMTNVAGNKWSEVIDWIDIIEQVSNKQVSPMGIRESEIEKPVRIVNEQIA